MNTTQLIEYLKDCQKSNIEAIIRRPEIPIILEALTDYYRLKCDYDIIHAQFRTWRGGSE